MHIGNTVRNRRKALKKTLQDIADDIPGYDAGNLSRFERGVQGIDSDKLDQIAKVLGTRISSLYLEAEEGVSRPPVVDSINLDEVAEYFASALQDDRNSNENLDAKLLAKVAILAYRLKQNGRPK